MTKSDKYGFVETAMDGVELRILADAKPDVPSEVAELFNKISSEFADLKAKIEVETAEQKGLKKKIIQFVMAIPGLRGVRSVPLDFDLLAILREKISFDRNLLKTSLGTAYPALVSEELVITITIPPGIIAEEEVRKKFDGLLAELGIPADDLAKIVASEIQLRIDDEKLDYLVEKGTVKLLPGAREVTTEWAVDVSPLKTAQKMKPAARRTKSAD